MLSRGVCIKLLVSRNIEKIILLLVHPVDSFTELCQISDFHKGILFDDFVSEIVYFPIQFLFGCYFLEEKEEVYRVLESIIEVYYGRYSHKRIRDRGWENFRVWHRGRLIPFWEVFQNTNSCPFTSQKHRINDQYCVGKVWDLLDRNLAILKSAQLVKDDRKNARNSTKSVLLFKNKKIVLNEDVAIPLYDNDDMLFGRRTMRSYGGGDGNDDMTDDIDKDGSILFSDDMTYASANDSDTAMFSSIGDNDDNKRKKKIEENKEGNKKSKIDTESDSDDEMDVDLPAENSMVMNV